MVLHGSKWFDVLVVCKHASAYGDSVPQLLEAEFALAESGAKTYDAEYGTNIRQKHQPHHDDEEVRALLFNSTLRKS
jgi:hypothetical protein